jgi:REP-associated tyrosine transposase
MGKYHIALQPDRFYHIFNCAVGNDLLFRNEDNFEFFLKRYALHTENICDTFSYSLMRNHFHFAIRIKPLNVCASHFEKIKKTAFNASVHNMPDFLMERFSNLCNSYTKTYNNWFNRKGALFIDYLKRHEVIDENSLLNLINYLHFNAVHHRFCKTPLDWKWSSVHTFLGTKRTKIKRREALDMFGGVEQFTVAHTRMARQLPEYEFL